MAPSVRLGMAMMKKTPRKNNLGRKKTKPCKKCTRATSRRNKLEVLFVGSLAHHRGEIDKRLADSLSQAWTVVSREGLVTVVFGGEVAVIVIIVVVDDTI